MREKISNLPPEVTDTAALAKLKGEWSGVEWCGVCGDARAVVCVVMPVLRCVW